MRVKQERIFERKKGLVKDYMDIGFNWQSVIRIKNFKDLLIDNKFHRTHIRPYNSKMTVGYIDRIMDNLVKRRNINWGCAFLEQDDYLNNHLHIAWKCDYELTRKQLSRSLKTRERYIREIMPISDEKMALEYFTKRLYGKGSYTNLYYE